MKFKKIVSVMSASLIALGLATSTSDAYALLGKKLNGGVTYRQYYVTSSASTHSSKITEMMNKWIYSTASHGITTPLNFSKSSRQYGSEMDFYGGSYDYYPYRDSAAWEEGWTYSGSQINQGIKNWDYSKIYLNYFRFNSSSTTVKKGTIAHEMGHAFGLAHVKGIGSLMCTIGGGRIAHWPTADEFKGINALYK